MLGLDADAYLRKSVRKEVEEGVVLPPVLSDTDIDSLITQRVAARNARDFKESDRLRDQLTANGIVLEDGPKGTTWRRG